jgi:hypothetical protein
MKSKLNWSKNSDDKDVSGHCLTPLPGIFTEDREDFMCAVVTVIFGVCNSVRLD